MKKLSVIIPSRNEIFLNHTIKDVLKNASGDIDIYPILDGYEPEELIDDPKVKYIRLPSVDYTQKRHGINIAVDICDSDYVMSLDAHCMVAEGFDEQLIKDHKDNWVQIPRRHRLDAENWSIQKQSDNRPPIDYEYFMFPGKVGKNGLHGYKWDSRTLDRWDIQIDDTMTFQGSCWFMTKDWFKKNNFMQIEGYTGWGQEAEEIGLTTWKNGGEVKTNKNTWYAHLHKGKTYGRMYFMSKKSTRECNAFSYDLWVNKNKDFFIKHIEKFWPVPGWPDNWKEVLYGSK